MATLADIPKLFAAKDWKRAEKLLRKAAQDRRAPAEVYFNLAKVLVEQGKTAQALTFFKRALALRKDFFEAWFEMGRLLMDSRDLDAARTAFERAADLRPQEPYTKRNLGRIALRKGDWKAAEAAYAGLDDQEARVVRYRAQVEQGHDGRAQLKEFLGEPGMRAVALRTMVQTAKGAIPRRV